MQFLLQLAFAAVAAAVYVPTTLEKRTVSPDGTCGIQYDGAGKGYGFSFTSYSTSPVLTTYVIDIPAQLGGLSAALSTVGAVTLQITAEPDVSPRTVPAMAGAELRPPQLRFPLPPAVVLLAPFLTELGSTAVL